MFTVPWYWWKETVVRAVRASDGSVHHLEPPDFHCNPIDEKGSLVTTEWGAQLCDFIYASSGMSTTAILIRDKRLGLDGEFCEVFVSRKAPALSADERPEIQANSVHHAHC